MPTQKIFFSYSRIDGSEFALRLALDLKRKGFDVWIDQEDIRAGSEWDIEIERALETCDCLLFIESEKSVNSNNVLDEVYYALEQNKKVIPIILIDSKTPFRLKRLQHINFTKDYAQGLSLLINELEGTTTGATYQAEEVRSYEKANSSFFAKYTWPILIVAAIIILSVAGLIYTSKSKDALPVETGKVANTNNSAADDTNAVATEAAADTLDDDIAEVPVEENRVKTTNRNKILIKKGTALVKKPGSEVADLNEAFAGDWELVDVNPKARSQSGYLKIAAIDNSKVTIKSYVQFYYFKTNETSFLSVFNAFSGCASCTLGRNMKLTTEDVAIGSQTIKTLKQDGADGKKGDTILNAGSNKSIRASVTLHLIDRQTALIKVQQTNPSTLAYELILQPFVYTFRFRKRE